MNWIKANRMNLFLAGLGFAPLLGRFFYLSWSRPAYQFYPLALVAAAMLAWRAVKQTGVVVPPASLWSTRWLALAAGMLYLLANLLWSPWLGFIAGLTGLTAFIWGMGGKPLLKAFAPALLMLLTILPPPFKWDEALTLWLRSVAVDSSSALLDCLNVVHLRDGNTLLLPGKTLLVEEACSGINSFVLCNACCLFWVLWQRRPLLWLLPALPATSLFVILGNVIRITIGTTADFRWQIDLLSGWRHETFGLGLLLVYCGLILSMDQLLVFLTQPVRRQAAGPGKPASPPSALPASGPQRPVTASGFRFAGAVLAVVGIGFFSTHLVADARNGLLVLPRSGSVRELKLSMPDRLAGWQRMSSTAGDQTLVQFIGVHSTLWHFQCKGSEAIVAVDYPLPGFHNVKVCYAGNGWRVLAEEELYLPQSREDLHAIRLTLAKSIHHALVYHSVVDERGAWISASETVNRFASAMPSPQAGYRIQLITGGYSPLSGAAAASAQELFFQARRILVPELVDQLRKGGAR